MSPFSTFLLDPLLRVFRQQLQHAADCVHMPSLPRHACQAPRVHLVSNSCIGLRTSEAGREIIAILAQII